MLFLQLRGGKYDCLELDSLWWTFPHMCYEFRLKTIFTDYIRKRKVMMKAPIIKFFQNSILGFVSICSVFSDTTPMRLSRSVLPLSISGIRITSLTPISTTGNCFFVWSHLKWFDSTVSKIYRAICIDSLWLRAFYLVLARIHFS